MPWIYLDADIIVFQSRGLLIAEKLSSIIAIGVVQEAVLLSDADYNC
jgi:hypothetical protein